MDEISIQNDNIEEMICKNCGSESIEAGYKINLCKECRDKYSKRTIPIGVKIFFSIIILIMIIATTKFTHSIKAGVAYERGNKAEDQGKYVTAMYEYEKVLDKYPKSILPTVRFIVSLYHNGRYDEVLTEMDKLYGKEMESELIEELNMLMDDITTFYYPSQEIVDIINKHNANYKSELLLMDLKKYVKENPEDDGGKYFLANSLYEFGYFNQVEELLLDILEYKPNSYYPKLLIIATYREKKAYAKAIDYCNKLLDKNSQDQYVYVALSRIELKKHNDKEGLNLAKKAYELNKQDVYAASNLSLAYHYNNLLEERDEMVNFIKKKNNQTEIEFLNSVFDGTYEWR